jgi:hypothetical protein
MSSQATGGSAAGGATARAGGGFNIKETLTAVVISFTMAFVFRGFVIEGFLIPTGSMAPTLLGKHMLVREPGLGHEWTVGPWDYQRARWAAIPRPCRGGRTTDLGQRPDDRRARRAGRASVPARGRSALCAQVSRGIYEPERWDVTSSRRRTWSRRTTSSGCSVCRVSIALVDGDVFVAPPGNHPASVGIASWEEDVWSPARKPERVQREVWQTVFDSVYTPDPATQQSLAPSERFESPWDPSGAGWSGIADSESYRYEGSGSTVLAWDSDVHQIDDYTPYNQIRNGAQRVGPRRDAVEAGVSGVGHRDAAGDRA